MISTRKAAAMENRPSEEIQTSILIVRWRGEELLGVLQLAEDDAEDRENDLRDQTAHSHVRANGHGLQEIGHDDHGTDVGAVESDQRADVVQPVAAGAQRLVHQLGVGVVGLDGLVRFLGVKQGLKADGVHLVDLLVQLDELVGGEDHHSANQGEQEDAGNDTDLYFSNHRDWEPG